MYLTIYRDGVTKNIKNTEKNKSCCVHYFVSTLMDWDFLRLQTKKINKYFRLYGDEER